MTAIRRRRGSGERRAQRIGIVVGGGSAGWIAGRCWVALLYDRFGYVLPFAVAMRFELGALLLALLCIPRRTHLCQRANGARPGCTGCKRCPTGRRSPCSCSSALGDVCLGVQ